MARFVPDKPELLTKPSGRFVPDNPTATTKKKKGNSVGGFISNLAGDVKEITYGAVPGLVHTVGSVTKDLEEAGAKIGPRRGGDLDFDRTKAIGKGIADTYAKNYGSWSGFKSALYNDPLFIALDALTVLSGGTTAAAKTGVISSKAGKTLDLAAGPRPVTKTLARNELRAQFQAATAKAANREIRVGDQVIRPAGVAAAKIEGKRARRHDVNVRAQGQQFDVAVRKLKKRPEKVATFLLARYDRPSLDAYLAHLDTVDSEVAAATRDIIRNPKVQALFDKPSPRMVRVLEEARPLADKQKGLLGISDDVAEGARFRSARVAEGARKIDDSFEGGPSIEELKARGLDPVYMPDTSSKPVMAPYGGKAGGIGEALPTGNMKKNEAALQLAGQLILDPAVLNQSFLKAAKYAHYSDIHDRLLEHASVVESLPEGWTFIRKKRTDRVDPKDKMRPDFDDWARAHLDDSGEWKTKESGLTTQDAVDAAWTEDGGYLAVPNGVAKALAGEFTRQAKFAYLMNKYPMRVWRWIVLGMRPAYLVNNAIGNTLLYLAHSGRPEDLRQLAGAFKQFAKKSEHGQIDALLQKHFAGQVRGGFVATQMPTFAPKNPVLKGAVAVGNAIPALDRRWEQALRRAKVKAELKRHPALREHANRMGRETEFFQQAEKILDDNPLVVEQVYDRVNDALGDYDSMAAWEKGSMRNLFPFYAWFKAIVGVSGKLTIEQPLKVNLIAQLAKIAVENNLTSADLEREDIPSSLLGFIPTGQDSGRVRGFNTAPVNPFATVGQLGEFAEALLPGGERAGPVAPGLNPLLVDVIGYLTGKNLSGYTTPNVPGVGTLDALPPARLLGAAEAKYGFNIPGVKTAPDGDTFNDRDFWDEMLRFGGVPYARVSPSAAKRVASR